jgi:hypothetical protein
MNDPTFGIRAKTRRWTQFPFCPKVLSQEHYPGTNFGRAQLIKSPLLVKL